MHKGIPKILFQNSKKVNNLANLDTHIAAIKSAHDFKVLIRGQIDPKDLVFMSSVGAQNWLVSLRRVIWSASLSTSLVSLTLLTNGLHL